MAQTTNVAPAKTATVNIDKEVLKNIKSIAVVHSHVERDFFPTEEAYKAEVEVIDRAAEVAKEVENLGFKVKTYAGDPYFLTNVLIDRPDLVINLVDTVRGKDALTTSIPAIMDFAEIEYTGTGMTGLVVGSNRHLFKQLLTAFDIPTPPYKFIRDLRSNTPPEFEGPYIVKLNVSGGSVGIDNKAVKKTHAAIKKKVEEVIKKYHIPVLIEKFIDGPEITAVVFEDGTERKVFMAQKKFNHKPDGQHEFTSFESYEVENSYIYEIVDPKLEEKIKPLVTKAYDVLRFRDYAKFDIRCDDKDGTPYFIDCNPNTAFGPAVGLPMTDVLLMHGVKFQEVLLNLIMKHAKKLQKKSD
jgi:D-alanine-D-alanine ligase